LPITPNHTMRSQLTRAVFRGLLSSNGLVLRCPHHHSTAARWRPNRRCRVVAGDVQTRTLWGFSRGEDRKPKEPSFAPGLETFLEFSKMMKVGARPPAMPDLVRAWKMFFDYKLRKKEAVNTVQATHVLRVFEYLRAFEVEKGVYNLATPDMRNARKALITVPKEAEEGFSKLAKAFHAEFERRGDWQVFDTYLLLIVLTQTGETAAARDLAHKHFVEEHKTVETNNPDPFPNLGFVWRYILEGFANEDNEAELLRTMDVMDGLGIARNVETQRIMVCFYTAKNDVGAVKKWYEKKIQRIPKPETLKATLEFSIRNNELEWCKKCFRDVLERNPSKKHWDVVFQWAAGAVGKGVEDVERMMEVMIRRKPDMKPDITTINGLVSLAISKNDPYLAERYIALGLKSGIRPNAQTFILQMNYRISAGDLRGAQTAYEALQGEEILNDEDLPAINNYLRALAAAKNPSSSHDLILSILSDLSSRHARLEASTVSALALHHLSRGEDQDVYDILQSNAYHYSISERNLILNPLISFVLDRQNSNARAWEAYQVLRQLFDETDITTRTKLMQEFFDRGRCDMACYVFGHMRAHALPSHRPVRETYTSCFLGIARHADAESLDMVHNMYKLDSSVEGPNTKLYNALMLAYTSTDDGDRALDFWDDITNSTEGPSYRSLEIVFRACEATPFGDIRAREIWAKMRRMDIEVTREVWSAYVGALAGRGKLDEAKSVIENGEAEFGLKPDFMTLGILYNALPGQSRKDSIEEWAKGMYPAAWVELEKCGQRTIDDGFVKLFCIERGWVA
ncbi:Mitochondrial complex I intermediate-associated protein, partial [Lachnellula suecica]